MVITGSVQISSTEAISWKVSDCGKLTWSHTTTSLFQTPEWIHKKDCIILIHPALTINFKTLDGSQVTTLAVPPDKLFQVICVLYLLLSVYIVKIELLLGSEKKKSPWVIAVHHSTTKIQTDFVARWVWWGGGREIYRESSLRKGAANCVVTA